VVIAIFDWVNVQPITSLGSAMVSTLRGHNKNIRRDHAIPLRGCATLRVMQREYCSMGAPQALTLSETGALLAGSLLIAALCFILPRILAFLIKIALSKANVVNNSVSVRVSIGLRPVLRLRLREVQLSNKLLGIINSGWAAALPLVMTRAAVEQLSLELDLTEVTRCPFGDCFSCGV
jgi:hypothetical protein